MFKANLHIDTNLPDCCGIARINRRMMDCAAIMLALCLLIAPAIGVMENAGDPQMMVNPIGTKTVGQSFILSGTTNLATGDQLQVEITSSSFGPTPKGEGGGFSGASGLVTVQEGTGGVNTWQFPVDTTGFVPDDYIVQITGITVSVTSSTHFTVVAATPTQTTVPTTPVPTSVITSIPSTSPTTPPPTTTPFGGTIAVAAVLSAIVIVLRRS